MLRPGVEYRDIHLAACIIAEGLVDLELTLNLVEMDAHALFFPHGVGHLGLDVHDMEDLGDLAGYEEDAVEAIAGLAICA